MTKLVNNNPSTSTDTVSSAELLALQNTLEAQIQAEVNARLDAVKYKGTYATLGDLFTAYPSGSEGFEANIDAGAGSDVQTAYWDTTDNQWVIQTGTGTAETSTSVLAKYSANAGVEPYTTDEQDKLRTVENYATNDQTAAEMVQEIQSNNTFWHFMSSAQQTKLDENVATIVGNGESLSDQNTSIYVEKYIDGYWYSFRCIDGDPTVDPTTLDTDKWSLEHDADEIFWHSEVAGYFTKYVQTVVLKNETGPKYKYDLYADLDTAIKRTTNPSSAAGVDLYHPHTGSPQG